MIANSNGISVKETIKGIWKHISKSPKTSLKFSRPSSIGYIKKIRSGSWDDLISQARKELTEHKRETGKLSQRRVQLTKSMTLINGLSDLYDQLFTPLLKTDSWSDLKHTIIKRLVKKGRSEENARSLVAKIEKLNSSSIEKNALLSTQSSFDRIDNIAMKRLASEMGSVLILAVARFNLNAEKSGKLNNAEKFLSASVKEITGILKQIHTSLKNTQPALLQEQCGLLVRTAAERLTGESLKYSAVLSVKRKSGTGASYKYGRLAMEFGELNRLLLFSIALGKRLLFLSSGNLTTGEFKLWIEKAKELDFGSKEDPFMKAAIASVISDPLKYRNKPISIEGVLSNISIVHKRRKAISSAVVSDSAGRSINIVLPYIKLDSGGITGGSYVRVSGIWSAKSKELDNKPALQLDRLSLKTLGEKNWLSWVEHMISPVYQKSPHSLNASWSWEAGIDGAANQIRYNTWHRKGANNGL